MWEGAAMGQMVAGIDGCDSESLFTSALLGSLLWRGGVGVWTDSSCVSHTEIVHVHVRGPVHVCVFVTFLDVWDHDMPGLMVLSEFVIGCSSHIPHIPQRGGSTTRPQAARLSLRRTTEPSQGPPKSVTQAMSLTKR